MNQYETQAMREILIGKGFKECASRDIADIYILNTCTVTEKADRESRYWIGMFHKTNPKAKIVVTGCYAENNAEEILFLPGITSIIKNEDKNRIAEILDPELKGSGSDQVKPLSITDFKGHTKAFIKIQDGCENRCAYCKVPFVRKSLVSKPIDDILTEARSLIDRGFKEIVLTGICLGAWGKDIFPHEMASEVGLSRAGIVDVLKAIDKIGGDFRIRISSIEPKYVTDELIELVSGSKRICKHLHIPLQSGDDEVLARMNRQYTSSEYFGLVHKAKSKIKDLAITTDVLIGFPGEGEESFRNTVSLIKDVVPLRTHIFTFSRRKGTAAYDMPQETKEFDLKKRYYELKVASLATSFLYRKEYLGKKLNILIESKRDKASGLLAGYSDNYIKTLIKGPDDIMKRIVPIKVDDMTLLHTLGSYE